MYIDIKQLKAIQARAIAAKIGSSIIEPIMKDIKKAAAEGKSEIKVNYKDYNISNNNIPYVCHWARICGFYTASYEEIMYINW